MRKPYSIEWYTMYKVSKDAEYSKLKTGKNQDCCGNCHNSYYHDDILLCTHVDVIDGDMGLNINFVCEVYK